MMTDLNVTRLADNKTSPIKCQTPSTLAKVGHWQGDLHLRYALSGSPLSEELSQKQTEPPSTKTLLVERYHHGPYTVQRPFYPEGDICHSILLHPPGGLVEGDTLSLSVECDEGAHCFLTTPSAGKTYECSHDFAIQKQVFRLQDRSVMEWFPQEMILYDRSKSDLRTEIRMFGDARFVGWEMTCLGRPIANDHFSKGEFRQFVSLYRDDKPVLLERTVLEVDDKLRESAFGLANFQAMGLFLMTGANKQHLIQAREAIEALDQSIHNEIQIGFTLLDDVLIGRVLMNQSRFAKTAFISVWSALREDILGVPAIMPRIWLT